MKKLTILAAALFATSAAYAQAPTNLGHRTLAAPAGPAIPRPANASPVTAGAGAGTYSSSPSAYSQDSYVSQSNSSNAAFVDQVDSRSTRGPLTGSSAAIVQTGTNGNAYQTQSLDGTSFGTGRNVLEATQAGNHNQFNQTQVGGFNSTGQVVQGVNTNNNQATQLQTAGSGNGARITQTTYNVAPVVASAGNIATQDQRGTGQSALIQQQGNHGAASQVQTGASNAASINQGSYGAHNSATQTQSGSNNKALSSQSVNYPQAHFDSNTSIQTQSGTDNSADINQRGNHGYAEQLQSGGGMGVGNISKIEQGRDLTTSNVSSAAYTVQTGMSNSVAIYQH